MTNEERAKGFAGAAILAAYITGSLSLVAAVVGMFINPILPGLALIAAAICFTGIANAMLRR